jgi:Rad3-related DNA helicase
MVSRSRSKDPASLDILDCFTRGKTPRPGQASTLKAVQKAWNETDVFVIEAPTGSGKSDMALTISTYATKLKLRSMTVVPNNVLLSQYLRDNPRIPTLRAKHDYTCREGSVPGARVSCKVYSAQQGSCCKGCPYVADNRKIRALPYGVVNVWTYMAHKLYPDVLLYDECHTALGMLRDMAAKKLWKHQYNWPDRVKDYKSLLGWVTTKREELKARRISDAKLDLVFADLTSGSSKYLVEKGTDLWHGDEREVLKLLPIDTSAQPPILWPSKVKKLVLLSATIGPKDLEQLGLSRKRVTWISTPSPIPPAQRPVRRERTFNLAFSAGTQDMDALAKYIEELCIRHKGERGVIHATYALMEQMRPRLAHLPRVMTHTRENKKEVYSAFLAGASDAVLLCAGLYEGIDLPGDLGRWQVIMKVPWASMAEPAWKYLAQREPDRYAFEALRIVMQGAGRVCRGPQDFGVTYLVDQSFDRIPEELIPGWFRESLQAGEVLDEAGQAE